ncbi:MAG: cytochrome B [Bacteroidetes bacterium]|nr:MAG: cytochrome B [Bacteroidota bacterium]
MFDILVRSHSGLRWIALLLLIIAIGNALASKSSGKYLKKDKMINLFGMVFLHVQLLLGLILYFMSPKVSMAEGWMKVSWMRFFTLEHALMMIVAIILVTIGRKKAEKESSDKKKHAKIALWYGIALVLIFLAIPWPFRANLGVTSWF